MVSSVKDLFEAEAGSFGDTMMAHNGVAGYKIPEYQCQYNWKKEHLSRLLRRLPEWIPPTINVL